jgi:alkylhydroperoxidase/carboxymuconolactone decarboxylase family protein YurZ
VCKKLFGEERKSKPDDTALDNFTIEHLFADVWSRPNLQMRQRSMITVALLAASGRDRVREAGQNGRSTRIFVGYEAQQ